MSALTPYHSSPNGTVSPAISSRPWQHTVLLVFLVFSFSLLTTFIVFVTTLYSSLPGVPTLRKKQIAQHATSRKKIVITGANTPLALTLARVLHAEGHTIFAADHESFPLSSPARASKAVKRFYKLGHSTISPSQHVQKGNAGAKISRFGSIKHASTSVAKGISEAQLYAEDVNAIVHHAGRVDLWIPCDQNTPHAALAAAREVIIKAGGGAIYPDPKFAQLGADEVAFAECIGALETPMKAPEKITVKSRGEIHQVLHSSPKGRQYMLEKIQATATTEKPLLINGNSGKRDSGAALSPDPSPPSSSDGNDLSGSFSSLLLPQPTINETYSALATIEISANDPWILHEVVATTGTEVSTHSLVVDSAVKTFIATSSPSLPMASYHSSPSVTSILSGSGAMTVSSSSALHSTLLAFTTSFAAALPVSTATHLSLTFQLHETPTATGTATIVIPRSCTVTPHASLALLASSTTDAAQIKRIAAAYVSAAGPKTLAIVNGTSSHEATTVTLPTSTQSSSVGLYSLPLLVLDMLVLPVLNLLLFRRTIAEVVASGAKFSEWIVFGTEDRWAWGDGGSWWWHWHIRYPIEVLSGALPRGPSSSRSLGH